MEGDRLSILQKVLSSSKEKEMNMIRSFASFNADSVQRSTGPSVTKSNNNVKKLISKFEDTPNGLIRFSKNEPGAATSKTKVESTLRDMVIQSPCKDPIEKRIIKSPYKSPMIRNDMNEAVMSMSGTKSNTDDSTDFGMFSIKKSKHWDQRASFSCQQSPSVREKISDRTPDNKLSAQLRDQAATISAQQKEIDRSKAQLAETFALARDREVELDRKSKELSELQSRAVLAEERQRMAQEEVGAVSFMCGLLEQRVDECETQLSAQRLDFNEELSGKARKYKAGLRRAQAERAEYESRANGLIAQMNEQMEALQKMAMDRIEVLESEMLTLRHTNEALEAEAARLRAAAAEAVHTQSPLTDSTASTQSNESWSPVGRAASRKKSRRSSALFSHGCGVAGLGGTLPKNRGLGGAITPVREEECEEAAEGGADPEDLENLHCNIALSPMQLRPATANDNDNGNDDGEVEDVPYDFGGGAMDGIGGWGDDFPADGTGIEGCDQ